jgi:hypothetical protein
MFLRATRDAADKSTKSLPRSLDERHDEHFCDSCSFRHAVMKAAGREQEFWDARKKEAEEKAAVAREQRRKIMDQYDAQMLQSSQSYSAAKSQIDNWVQQMQNVYPGALIPSDNPSGSVQKPEDPMPDKGWWKKFAEWRAKQK